MGDGNPCFKFYRRRLELEIAGFDSLRHYEAKKPITSLVNFIYHPLCYEFIVILVSAANFWMSAPSS
jgi:hypothetical protein